MICVLGPVDVMTPAGLVELGGRHARALPGCLVTGVGHAVPMEQLEDALWSDRPPDSADNTLQSYVSHLRQILGAEATLLTDHSSELDVAAESIDALGQCARLRRVLGDVGVQAGRQARTARAAGRRVTRPGQRSEKGG